MAKEVCVPLNVAAPVLYYYNLVKRIHKRLTTIITYLPTRARHNKVPRDKVTRPSQESMIAQSGHIAYIQGCRVRCARCYSTFHKKDPSASHLFDAPCPKEGSVQDRPVPLRHEAIHIGRRVIHHSHAICVLRGVIYCNKCGMRGTCKLHNLSKQ